MSMFQKISSTLEFSRDPEICITSNLVWNGKKLRFRGCSWLGGYFAKAKVWEGYVLMFLHENMEESSCDFLPKCVWSEDLDRILKSEGQLVAGSCLLFRKCRNLFLAAVFSGKKQSVVLIAQSAHGMDAANRCGSPPMVNPGRGWELKDSTWRCICCNAGPWTHELKPGGKDAECLPWHVARNFGWNIQFIQYMRPTACRIAGIAVQVIGCLASLTARIWSQKKAPGVPAALRKVKFLRLHEDWWHYGIQPVSWFFFEQRLRVTQ